MVLHCTIHIIEKKQKVTKEQVFWGGCHNVGSVSVAVVASQIHLFVQWWAFCTSSLSHCCPNPVCLLFNFPVMCWGPRQLQQFGSRSNLRAWRKEVAYGSRWTNVMGICEQTVTFSLLCLHEPDSIRVSQRIHRREWVSSRPRASAVGTSVIVLTRSSVPVPPTSGCELSK